MGTCSEPFQVQIGLPLLGAALGRDLNGDAMHRLHEKGYITDSVGKAKSVVFTEEGLRESQRLFRELFSA
jgi:hypothetical protein